LSSNVLHTSCIKPLLHSIARHILLTAKFTPVKSLYAKVDW
jgi:hypothetical protein